MACSAKLKMSSVKIHLTPHRKRGGSKKIKIKRQKKQKNSENYRDHSWLIKVQWSYRRAV